MRTTARIALVVLAACSCPNEQERYAARRDRWYEATTRAANEMPRPVQDADAPEACPHRPSDSGRSCPLTERQRTDLHFEVVRLRSELRLDVGRACFDIAVRRDWSVAKLDGLARRCRAMEIDFEGRTLLHTLDDRELRAFAEHLGGSSGTLRQRLDASMSD